MKNAVQVLEVYDQDMEIRELIQEYFLDHFANLGNDSYHRYYPLSSKHHDKKFDGVKMQINRFLVKEGYYIDWENQYFHILMRFSW